MSETIMQAELIKTIVADDIVGVLDAYYRRRTDVIHFAELRIGTGYGKDAEQRIDYWAMEMYASKGFKRISYEIKVSRSDFLHEIKNPKKRRRALLWSNEYYFITLPGIVRVGELPPEVGLIEVTEGDIAGDSMYVSPVMRPVIAAPWRDTIGPTWRFLAAIARASEKKGRDKR